LSSAPPGRGDDAGDAHSLHCQQIMVVAAAGKAVFCEKPLTLQLGDVIRLQAHFSNEVAGTFTEWRHSPEESPAGGTTGTGIHILDAP
jgi:hypothetical protein